LYERGYCSDLAPKTITQISSQGKIYYSIKFRTWSFSSFNYIYDLFYKNKVKIVPKDIGNYLTPLALAIWFMDDGSKHSAGVLLHTNLFSKEEVELLQKVLLSKYGLITTLTTKISKSTPNKAYIIYVWKKSLPDFISIFKLKAILLDPKGYFYVV
jgi:hypothetical protein